MSSKNTAPSRGQVPKKDASLVSVSSDHDEFEKNISDCLEDSTSLASTVSSMPEETKTKKPSPSSSRSLDEVATETKGETGESDDGMEKTDSDKITHESSDSDEDEDEGDNDEGWKNLPSLLEWKSTPGGKFEYLTKDIRFQQFELQQRKELEKMKEGIETFRANSESALKVMRSLCPEVKNGKVKDIIRQLGEPAPTTFGDLVMRVMSLDSDTNPNLQPATTATTTVKRSENPQEATRFFTPIAGRLRSRHDELAASSNKLPKPSKMAKYETPKSNQEICELPGQDPVSTNKAPRMPKPGEILYSKSGSPIVQRRGLPADSHAQERIKINEPDGTKIEVDVVLRGNNDPRKVRLFQEVARDFRHVVETRSTVKQNRVLPPKIKKAQSATKKPEWR